MEDIHKLSSQEVDACIAYWQGKLNLLHWRVTWLVAEDSQLKIKTALMEIAPTRIRHSACIWMKQSTYDKFSFCTREFQGYIVHELTHLILDPIAEEHSLQTEYCVQNGRHQENVNRFKRTLEKAVEHIAVQVVKQVPLYDAQLQLKTQDEFKQHDILARAKGARLISAGRRSTRKMGTK